jgi:hypothetical protein
MSATLGSYNWLGFITYGLSPYQKRLALLGAQQFLFVVSRRVISGRGDGRREHYNRLQINDIFLPKCVYLEDFRSPDEVPGAWLISLVA